MAIGTSVSLSSTPVLRQRIPFGSRWCWEYRWNRFGCWCEQNPQAGRWFARREQHAQIESGSSSQSSCWIDRWTVLVAQIDPVCFSPMYFYFSGWVQRYFCFLFMLSKRENKNESSTRGASWIVSCNRPISFIAEGLTVLSMNHLRCNEKDRSLSLSTIRNERRRRLFRSSSCVHMCSMVWPFYSRLKPINVRSITWKPWSNVSSKLERNRFFS